MHSNRSFTVTQLCAVLVFIVCSAYCACIRACMCACTGVEQVRAGGARAWDGATRGAGTPRETRTTGKQVCQEGKRRFHMIAVLKNLPLAEKMTLQPILSEFQNTWILSGVWRKTSTFSEILRKSAAGTVSWPMAQIKTCWSTLDKERTSVPL